MNSSNFWSISMTLTIAFQALLLQLHGSKLSGQGWTCPNDYWALSVCVWLVTPVGLPEEGFVIKPQFTESGTTYESCEAVAERWFIANLMDNYCCSDGDFPYNPSDYNMTQVKPDDVRSYCRLAAIQ
ncbi:hypothetical protein PGTUg99_015630 [Puccinia graminis f. sp. tritici]|uniref:Uncharacterized protein n=2 Tax=Puccinia graminis f. sp. tritici TaxID=56615 RepID=A0A5B0P2K7_PUCGR|nr:hypothetical protein PGTUg99_015630 [Puccinia graminis f. sp. tritici]